MTPDPYKHPGSRPLPTNDRASKPISLTNSKAERTGHHVNLRHRDSAIRELLAALPEEVSTGGLYNRAINLPNPAFLIFIGAEYLIASRNPNIDPVLSKWLDKHVEIAGQYSSDKDKATYLLKAVKETFDFTDRTILHPIKSRYFNQMCDQRRHFFC